MWWDAHMDKKKEEEKINNDRSFYLSLIYQLN